nr:hypothetical protein [Bacteroidota bacterium]
MGNKTDPTRNPMDALLENVRFLSKDIVSKILLKEEFTAPAITSYGMNSFHMSLPNSHRY